MHGRNAGMPGTFIIGNQINVSCEVHVPTSYYPAKETMVPTKYEAGRLAGLMCAL
jgi:hypothetical protein